MPVQEREFDIVVFGAAGCTGRYLLEELVKIQGKNPTENFTWAVAGQDMHELESALQEISTTTEKDYTSVEKIMSDALDFATLTKMAAKCKVLINCVGPFRFLGENVVKACLAEGTHLIEAAGEVQYLLKMQLLHNKEAEEKGIYIIASCGYASIPADCGTILMEQTFPGDLNSVEIFYEMSSYSMKARKANFASLIAMIHILANLKEWEELEKKVLNGPKFCYKYPLKNRIIHYNKDVLSWCIFNFQCDMSVVRRSQHLLYQTENKRPVQARSFIKFRSLISALFAIICLVFFAGLCQIKLFRLLIKKFPKICTLGTVDPNKRITGNLLKNVGFKFTIVGHGWNSTLTDASDQHSDPPDVIRRIEVSGYDPFYGGSGIMLIQSALTVLHEKNKLPGRGGVLPPGASFARTTLVKRLNSNGVKFKILREKP